GRTRRAGILDAGRRLEAQPVVGLQHEAGGEILRREAGVEMPEHDLVHVIRADAGMVQRLRRDLDDQALDGLVLQLAETRMRPADDACGHFRSPYLATSVARLRRLSSPIYCSIMNV